MEGWSCAATSESRPQLRLMAEKPANENNNVTYYQRQQPAVFDWSVTDGILTGEPKPEAAADKQSRIRYLRPLLNGESLQYEFFYVPGSSVAHPTIGRLAMLLHEDGVKTHWIVQPGWDDSFSGIPLDNEIDEREFRRGPATLPLRPNEWNTVDITLNEQGTDAGLTGVADAASVGSNAGSIRHEGTKVLTAAISLNGTVVFERPVADALDTQVGMFRYQRQQSKIRNAVLTGPWPTELSDELRNDLLAVKAPLSAGNALMVEAMLPDAVYELQIPELLSTAKDLPTGEAYEMLRGWVLPTERHRSIRLMFRPAVLEPEADPAVRTDADLQSPALELLRLAEVLNRAAELTAEIEAISPVNDVDRRNRQALLAMLALQSQQPERIAAAMSEVYATLEKGLPQSLTPQQRAAEVLVAWQAMQTPVSWQFASELAYQLRAMERDEKARSNDDRFHRLVHSLIGRIDAKVLSASAELNESPDKNQREWAPVPYLKPEHMFLGQRPSHWKMTRSQTKHLPAEMWTQLFFQSPLQGKFEILAERSTFGHKEVAITWGMHSAEPNWNLQSTRVIRLMHESKEVGGPLQIPNWNTMAEFRIVVDGSKVTTFTNGVQIHEENMEGTPSPWIVLQSHMATNEATIRNLRIVGTPEIPAAISLVDMSGLSAWRADIYAESHSVQSGDENSAWLRTGDEIVGKLRRNVSASPSESLLMYQRPMLENGEIEFESFWTRGEVEVHPAVGKSAFLIQPGGVQLHTLTNAQFETRDLMPDNATMIEGSASNVALKDKDWNRIKLSLKGDRLTLTVNGADVATHIVTEPPNERFFGLFRYTDKTQCRVRNIVYRGDWPKTLPPVEEQELAYPAGGPAQFFTGSDAGTDVVDLTLPLVELQNQGWSVLGPVARLSSPGTGLKMTLSEALTPQDWPGVMLERPIAEDCEITLDFSQLTMTPVKEGWGNGIDMLLRLDDPLRSDIECEVSLNGQGAPRVRSSYRRYTPAGSVKDVDYAEVSGMKVSGRLRLVRHGAELFALFAEAGTDEFRLIESYTIGNYPIKNISLRTKSSDAQSKVDVLIERLTIRKK